MPLETFECKRCGDTFEAHENTRAAELGYCSRECMNHAATEA